MIFNSHIFPDLLKNSTEGKVFNLQMNVSSIFWSNLADLFLIRTTEVKLSLVLTGFFHS